jgi:hypothetical protein
MQIIRSINKLNIIKIQGKQEDANVELMEKIIITDAKINPIKLLLI